MGWQRHQAKLVTSAFLARATAIPVHKALLHFSNPAFMHASGTHIQCDSDQDQCHGQDVGLHMLLIDLTCE